MSHQSEDRTLIGKAKNLRHEALTALPSSVLEVSRDETLRAAGQAHSHSARRTLLEIADEYESAMPLAKYREDMNTFAAPQD